MGILQITTDTTGQINVNPRRVKIVTTDNVATILTAGYLNAANLQGFTILPTDVFDVILSYNTFTKTGSYEVFTPTFSHGVITLIAWANPGDVIGPTVAGDFAIFQNTTGSIGDNGYAPTDPTKASVVMLNAAPTINHIAQFTATNGTIGDGGVLGQAAAKAVSNNSNATVASVGGATIAGHIATFADVAGTVQDGGLLAANILTSAITNPDVAADLISFDITVGQAALASGGSVNLIVSTSAKQYKIRSLQLNSGGTNFSGGGGDRLGQVTDGTTVYSVIPAATMQALTNGQWGVTAIPNPAGAAINTSTVAGASLVFKYSGGTTDYTAGSLVITGIAQRVA